MKLKKNKLVADSKKIAIFSSITLATTGLGRLVNQNLPTKWFRYSNRELSYFNESLQSQLIIDLFSGIVYAYFAVVAIILVSKISLRYFDLEGEEA